MRLPFQKPEPKHPVEKHLQNKVDRQREAIESVAINIERQLKRLRKEFDINVPSRKA